MSGDIPAFAGPPGMTPAVNPPLDPAFGNHRKILGRIQGNILKFHGRAHTRLILFCFERESPDPALRSLLSDAVSEDNVDAGGLRWKVTSALDQWEQARARTPGPQGTFYSLALTYRGLRRCGYSDGALPLVADEGERTGFGAMMSDPDVAQLLGDRRESEGVLLPDWEPVYRDAVDGVWIIAHAELSELDAAEDRVTRYLEKHRAKKVGVERGETWKDDQSRAREPFGFCDGISDPPFFAQDCFWHEDRYWIPKWLNIPRSQALIEWSDPEHSGPSVHHGGSFLVLRKLEQNVAAFRQFEETLQAKIVSAGMAEEFPEAAALLIGRRRDGTPLSPTPPSHPEIDQAGLNRFEFQAEEQGCPFHAHIRKAAPRLDGQASGLVEHWEARTARSAVFVRRSVVYDELQQLPPSGTLACDPAAPSELRPSSYRSRHGEPIERGVGLLFMGYMSSIVSQFQELQSDWFGSHQFPFEERGLQDPLLRTTKRNGEARQWNWPRLGDVRVPLGQFVVPKGGAYFYTPSMDWLRAQTPPRTNGRLFSQPFSPERAR